MINTQNIPMSKIFFPHLQPIVGQDLYIQFGLRYGDLYLSQLLPKSKDLQHHLIDGILPGLALYQILREDGKTQEEALKTIDQAFEQLFMKNRKKMQQLGRLPFVYSVLRKYIKTAMHQYPEEGWKIEWTQNDKAAVRFNMKSCYYFDTLSKLGAPELTTSFCRVDDTIYGEMSPFIEWKRTQTIGRGASYCDFCFASTRKQ